MKEIVLLDNKKETIFKEITLKQGDEFNLELEANPSTGYFWEFLEPINDSVIELTGEKYKNNNPGAMGTSGIYFLTFKGISAGNTFIKLAYLQSFNKQDVIKQLQYLVTVA